MRSDGTDLVVKSNRLVEAAYRLDLDEQRIILAAIVEAREAQTGLGDGFITIEARRFAKIFSIDERNVYRQLKEALNSLYDRSLSIRDTDPETGMERVSKARWISSQSYIDGAGRVQLRFTPEVVPYITRLESEFTAYRLEKIGGLSSVHAVRVYELLVQYLPVGTREIEVQWFKETLQITAMYPALKDFKKRVLDVSISQINAHTDIAVTYAQRKTGRAVTHLVFSIKPKATGPAAPKAPTKPKRIDVLDEAYLGRHARPGESRAAAIKRLLAERGTD